MTPNAPPTVMPGAEPWSHTAAATADGVPAGLLTLHGFTGNPSSMRGFAEAAGAGGFHVELPRLPGHGTSVEDMLPTRWSDWTEEVERAYGYLAERTDRIVVAGLSMGGSLALRTALRHPEIRGLVLVNPATQPQSPELREMVQEAVDGGLDVVPGIGSDIADPDAHEIAYHDTPLRPLISFLDDGLEAITTRFHELTMPLLLWTSRQDHVVDPSQSEHLAATYGGAVDHRWLERSYHVATQDFDRDIIFLESIDFARRVAEAGP